MKIQKILLILLMLNTFLMSAQAHKGVKLFTQPDGTKFEGVLRGDSSFHWIQSSGNIVVYSPSDKYYYIAKFDEVKGLILTDTKPTISSLKYSPSRSKSINQHIISNADKQNIYLMYKKSKVGNYPR